MKRSRIMALVLSVAMLLPCMSTVAAEDYMSNVTASIENADGHILFGLDQNAVLTLDATAITSAPEELYAKISIKTATGDVVANDLVDLTAAKLASYTIKEIPEYGIYTLEIDLYGKDSYKYYGKLESSFSVVNGPEEGTLNPVHGVCVHYRDGQDMASFGDTLITTDLAAKAGFSSARSEVTWNKYASYDETGNAVYNIASRQADIMNNIAANGMDILEILSYDHTSYPMSASGRYNNNMTIPFVNYAESLVNDVQDINDNAEFEIWNEWNNEGSWFNEDSLSPQSYAKLAKAVYEKVGGKATLWGMSTLGVDVEWIEEVLEEWDNDGYFWQNKNDNQQLYMDGISLHPYANWSQPEGSAYINTPAWTIENPVYTGPVEETLALKEMLDDRGIGSTPLRATEWGWVSTGAKAYQSNSSTDSSQVFVGYYPDRNMQAAYFVRMAALAEGNNLYDKMDYYQINSKNGADDSDFGLLMSSTSKVPYAAKPAYLAAANYNRIMTGAYASSSPVELDGVYVASFTLADGTDCAIIWSAALNSERTKAENVIKNISASLGDTEITVCDMLGNEIAVASATGEYNFKVDGQPIYVMGDFTAPAFTNVEEGSMIDECYYNAVTDTIVIKGKAAEAVAVLKKDGEAIQTFDLVSSANTVTATMAVNKSVEAGDYVLEITADGNVYTKNVTIPERIFADGQPADVSRFAPGMIALYTPSTRNVKVIGKLESRNENEPIIVMVAKAPAKGAEIANEDIAYVEVFTGSEENFEFNFTLPENAVGDYVVKAGAMHASNTSENDMANTEYAVVCTFSASVQSNTITASATFANYSEEETLPATMIIAQYDANDRFKSVKFAGQVIGKSDANEERVITETVVDGAVKCKIFVWNSQAELVPLVDAITIPQSEWK